MRKIALNTFVCLTTLALLQACSGSDDINSNDEVGDGDGDDGGNETGWSEEGAGDGDGAPGDGDGAPGDGDGDPTGDGDGDTSGDGDGDGDEEPVCNEADEVVLYLSPDDSNSMSSPVHVRERVLVDNSTALANTPVRPWEFMNYYTFAYEPADDGELMLHAAMQPVEDDPSAWRLQLAVSSEVMTPDERPSMNLTLVLDTSGSMAGEPIELLKESCRAIAAQLRVGDTVSIVEWDTENTWTLAGYAITGPNDAILLEKINAVTAGGGTDLNGGLVSGYQLAQQVFDADKVNRLVLVSDGGANAGVTAVELIAQNAIYGGSDGIYLVGVGVAKGSNYNDKLMNEVTDAGKGASVLIVDPDEAWKVFGTNFENTMAIAGRNVQVELTMPPGFEIVKFSGEEFSGNPDEVEPQHIAPNDAMVFYQLVQTCAPDLVDDDAELTVVATWEDPWTFETKMISHSWSFAELLAADPSLLIKGEAIFYYAESLAEYRKAYNNADKQAALVPGLAAVAAAQDLLPEDDDIAEIALIINQLVP